MKSAWEQFKEEFKEEVIAEGIAQGIAQGMERGEEKAYISSIRAVMANFQLTAEKAMDMLSIPKTKQGHYKAML